MAVWIARFGNRAMAGMFPVKDKRDGSRCRRLSRRQSERKSVFLGAAKVKRPSRWSTGWTKAGEVAKVGVGAQCWAGWADMCVPTRVFDGGCGASRALQRPVYNVPVRLGCHVRGVPAIQSSASCHSAPQGVSGTHAASGRDHRGRLAVDAPLPMHGGHAAIHVAHVAKRLVCRPLFSRSAAKGPSASPRSLMLTLSSLSPRSPITAIRRPVERRNEMTPGSRAVVALGFLP